MHNSNKMTAKDLFNQSMAIIIDCELAKAMYGHTTCFFSKYLTTHW